MRICGEIKSDRHYLSTTRNEMRKHNLIEPPTSPLNALSIPVSLQMMNEEEFSRLQKREIYIGGHGTVSASCLK